MAPVLHYNQPHQSSKDGEQEEKHDLGTPMSTRAMIFVDVHLEVILAHRFHSAHSHLLFLVCNLKRFINENMNKHLNLSGHSPPLELSFLVIMSPSDSVQRTIEFWLSLGDLCAVAAQFNNIIIGG